MTRKMSLKIDSFEMALKEQRNHIHHFTGYSLVLKLLSMSIKNVQFKTLDCCIFEFYFY